ncbi:uncharacterized protein UMAG_10982 [Mycosarcoma maydis]|uniref:RRM domain-containing protein n=1 Tax=Mycosarcoma maydis TaxID=5270 RepID=A0A0D1DYE3_MYCMD|nr:uncharacterized protein UMAG_10982 [Ustilago maydis 521]KIS68661.1 hypothetical protein UMAG_10982 [Ustilago maydis 521]|eukprot:XP_011389828.1 hypothetical protein UMAG_10982 [Ustilago maydis 521]
MSTSSATVYVGNIPAQLDETSLSSYFAPFGDIVSVSVPFTSTPTGRRNKGFGFVTFSSTDDALDAIDNMHLNAIRGRTVEVNLADAAKVKQGVAGGATQARAVWDDEEWMKRHAANEQDDANASIQNDAQHSQHTQTPS